MLEAAISNKQTHLGHRIKITKSLNRSTFFPLALSVLFREQFFFSVVRFLLWYQSYKRNVLFLFAKNSTVKNSMRSDWCTFVR